MEQQNSPYGLEGGPISNLCLWRLKQRLPQPHSIIRVRNLQTSFAVSRDAWGRDSKGQPALVSVAVSLRRPFESASTKDEVTKSTVHYGILSKSIIKFTEDFNGPGTVQKRRTLADYLNGVSEHLFFSDDEDATTGILQQEDVQYLESKLFLPKASLLGAGVSMTFTWVPLDGQVVCGVHMILQIHDLRIPTLIGVNDVERLAKQVVIANVTLDPCFEMSEKGLASDSYCELEEIVVKTIEESSFQTLEALATHISSRIITYFILPKQLSVISIGNPSPHIHITLEKPTAVTFADAPMIEVSIDVEETILAEIKAARAAGKSHKDFTPPFPLNGRLDAWIAEREKT